MVVNFLHNCLFSSRCFYVYCFSSNNNCMESLNMSMIIKRKSFVSGNALNRELLKSMLQIASDLNICKLLLFRDKRRKTFVAVCGYFHAS
jgi:hypothetical protein